MDGRAKVAAVVAFALIASIAAAKNWQWKPAPVARAPDPSETVRTAPASAWRSVDPANLLVIDLKEGGRAIVELAPEFAPIHVANIRAFAKARWWDGAGIYRVQDNYVAQWGNNEGKAGLPGRVIPRPPAIIAAFSSGSAVAQKAHSAMERPIYQCVRPQPGQ